MRGAVGTAGTFVLSWQRPQHNLTQHNLSPDWYSSHTSVLSWLTPAATVNTLYSSLSGGLKGRRCEAAVIPAILWVGLISISPKAAPHLSAMSDLSHCIIIYKTWGERA